MRLRQAQAILEAARAFRTLGMADLNFETFPIDHDRIDVHNTPDDYLTGYAELTDPDTPGSNARVYNLDIKPGPGTFDLTVRLQFGFGPDGKTLLNRVFPTWGPLDDWESHPFREGTGTAIAGLVETTVRVHEKPFEDAYQRRAQERTQP